MKIKMLEWEGDADGPVFNTDAIPQILYGIRDTFDYDLQKAVKCIRFAHGYVRDVPELIGTYFTLNDAKAAAQAHFERYVIDSFFQAE